jgi:DNA-binding PadR family transcriptional regulator
MKTQNPHNSARSPEFALLGFLFDHANYGYQLHQLLVTELGYVWHISQSQTYAILKRLVNQGDLTSTLQDQEKLPTRQLLQITPAGRRRFKEWLEQPTGSSVRAIRLEFLTRLYFAQNLFPESLTKMLSAQITEVESALARLKNIQNGVPPEQTFNRMGLELRIRQLGSIRTWLDECRTMLGI